MRALVGATLAAGEIPDPDLAERTLLRVAPAVAHRAVADPESGLDDLAFLARVTHGSLPARVRWTAQNALLAARAELLPTMRDRGDDFARQWCTAFVETAELLGVALDQADGSSGRE